MENSPLFLSIIWNIPTKIIINPPICDTVGISLRNKNANNKLIAGYAPTLISIDLLISILLMLSYQKILEIA